MEGSYSGSVSVCEAFMISPYTCGKFRLTPVQVKVFDDKEDQILHFTDRGSKLKVVIHNGHE